MGGERHARVVLPDEPIGTDGLVADEPAVRALPFADDEARGATELLGDAVRYLRQVIQVEAQMVRPRTRLRAPVLDDGEVLGLRPLSGGGQCVAGTGDQSLDQ